MKTIKSYTDIAQTRKLAEILPKVLSTLIPELAEDNGDKIGKQLLNWFKDCKWDTIDNGTLKRDDIIAWLEKHTGKVEPKFKVGDIIKHNRANIVRKVVSVNSTGSYFVEDIYTGSGIELFNAEQDFHLWTIQDARNGDVLASNNGCPFIYKKSDDTYARLYCCVTIANNFCVDDGVVYCGYKKSAKPATKKQCDHLFQKMKEAGYEWDAEKKELRKIEQKPVWNEEDDIEISVLINALGEFETYRGDFTKEKNWLKTLKERVQPKQELNEEVVNECVDLGLPSGTLWKPFNEEGYYTYDEAVEKFGDNLPTREQWEELKEMCKWKWKGNGYDVTGPNGHTIYLHAEGCRNGTEMFGVGTFGVYWSNTYYGEEYASGNNGYRFGNNDISVYNYDRYYSLSVRLVRRKKGE